MQFVVASQCCAQYYQCQPPPPPPRKLWGPELSVPALQTLSCQTLSSGLRSRYKFKGSQGRMAASHRPHLASAFGGQRVSPMVVQTPLGRPPAPSGHCGSGLFDGAGAVRGQSKFPSQPRRLGATWHQLTTACLQTLLTTLSWGALRRGDAGAPVWPGVSASGGPDGPWCPRWPEVPLGAHHDVGSALGGCEGHPALPPVCSQSHLPHRNT